MLSMKKLLTPLLGLYLFLGSLFSQNMPSDVYRPSQAKDHQTLNGEINTLCFFVHTARDFWNEEEMTSMLAMLEASQEWMIAQARRYGQKLSFRNDRFMRNYEPVYIRSVYAGDSKRTLNKAIEQLNFSDLSAFLEWYGFDQEKEKLKAILFVKDNSRSHAYNYFSHEDVDIAVVYYRNHNIPSDKYVIAHEILHLFGAWDLYHGISQSREKAEQARALYPHSVMINTYHNQSQLEVDELTAWRVGWHDDFKESYMDFSPVRKDRSRDHINDIHWRFDLVRKRDSLGNVIKKRPRGANSLARKAFLFGYERVYAMGSTFRKGQKPQYASPFGLFLEYKLLDRLYIATAINNHKIAYHTVEQLNSATIKPGLLPFLPGTTYKGDILTRRNVKFWFWEYPLRATYVLQKKKNLEVVLSQSIGLNRYDTYKRTSFYWYQSDEEYRNEEYLGWLGRHDKTYWSFTTGFGIRKSLLRRWHLNANLQLTYLGFQGGDSSVEVVKYRTGTIGVNIGLKYNLRNELYEYSAFTE